jgi:hypothetical protein
MFDGNAIGAQLIAQDRARAALEFGAARAHIFMGHYLDLGH